MGMAELFSRPWAAAWLRSVGAFPVNRTRADRAAVRTALAQLSGAPVVPCVILGSDRLYCPRRWLPWRRTPIWIAFGEAMFCAGKDRRSRLEFEVAIARNLRALGRKLRATHQLREEDFPMPPQLRRIGK